MTQVGFLTSQDAGQDPLPHLQTLFQVWLALERGREGRQWEARPSSTSWRFGEGVEMSGAKENEARRGGLLSPGERSEAQTGTLRHTLTLQHASHNQHPC